MSRVTGPGSVPNFWLISQLFWALSCPRERLRMRDGHWVGLCNFFTSPHPPWGPLEERVTTFSFPAQNTRRAWLSKDGPHGPAQQWVDTCCVYSIFIAHSGDPELRSVLPFFPQTLFEHHAEGSGAGLEATEHGCTPPCDTAVGLG